MLHQLMIYQNARDSSKDGLLASLLTAQKNGFYTIDVRLVREL